MGPVIDMRIKKLSSPFPISHNVYDSFTAIVLEWGLACYKVSNADFDIYVYGDPCGDPPKYGLDLLNNRRGNDSLIVRVWLLEELLRSGYFGDDAFCLYDLADPHQLAKVAGYFM
jgi:hypothetical protein